MMNVVSTHVDTIKILNLEFANSKVFSLEREINKEGCDQL